MTINSICDRNVLIMRSVCISNVK